MAGWIRMKIKGAAGDSIRLRFAELLQPDGELYMDNLRDARVTDTYICRGLKNKRHGHLALFIMVFVMWR